MTAVPSQPHITPVHGPGFPPPLAIRAKSLGPGYKGRRITLNGVTGEFVGVKFQTTVKVASAGGAVGEHWPVAVIDEQPGRRVDVEFKAEDVVTLLDSSR
jgi:hypothetical protein